MATKSTFKLPFNEASRFFQEKLSIPTGRWDDLWQEQHAKGFMVAGAMKADLLADFRAAIDKSIAGGMTLQEFRGQFDNIVQKHGWAYNGGRNWRSALIYDTNVTTAYQAGRWQQFQESGATHLMYLHADGVMNPRPHHVALHGTVRPIGDAFWKTHYPPNGWGCKCRAVIADAGEETGVPAAAYDPKTIDQGWAYNVGAAGVEPGYQVLTRKLESLPYQIAKSWTESMLSSPPFEQFFMQKLQVNFPVAVLNPADLDALGASSQTVWFSPESLAEHLVAHPEIGIDDYRKIQKIMDQGEVYLQPAGRVVFLSFDGRLYRAAVKTTRARHENFLLTLFETSDEKALAEVRTKYERVR